MVGWVECTGPCSPFVLAHLSSLLTFIKELVQVDQYQNHLGNQWNLNGAWRSPPHRPAMEEARELSSGWSFHIFFSCVMDIHGSHGLVNGTFDRKQSILTKMVWFPQLFPLTNNWYLEQRKWKENFKTTCPETLRLHWSLRTWFYRTRC